MSRHVHACTPAAFPSHTFREGKKIPPPGTPSQRGLITMMTGEQPESLASNRTVISTIFMATVNYDRLQDTRPYLANIILIIIIIIIFFHWYKNSNRNGLHLSIYSDILNL